MSREILKLVQKIDSSTVDLQMVLQCAPVLAGLKVSNMLSISRAFYPCILEVLKQTVICCGRQMKKSFFCCTRSRNYSSSF